MPCEDESNQRGCNIERPDQAILTDLTTMALSERTFVVQAIPM